MQQADFYLLESPREFDHLRFTCKLVEKAFGQGLHIHVQAISGEQAEELNDMLWHFKPDSFVPHAIGQSQYAQHPVTIDVQSASTTEGSNTDLLVLLSCELPGNYQDFSRVSLITPNDPSQLQQARSLYKHLQSLNITANIHDFRQAK